MAKRVITPVMRSEAERLAWVTSMTQEQDRMAEAAADVATLIEDQRAYNRAIAEMIHDH